MDGHQLKNSRYSEVSESWEDLTCIVEQQNERTKSDDDEKDSPTQKLLTCLNDLNFSTSDHETSCSYYRTGDERGNLDRKLRYQTIEVHKGVQYPVERDIGNVVGKGCPVNLIPTDSSDVTLTFDVDGTPQIGQGIEEISKADGQMVLETLMDTEKVQEEGKSKEHCKVDKWFSDARENTVSQKKFGLNKNQSKKDDFKTVVDDRKETVKKTFPHPNLNEDPVLDTLDKALKYFNLDNDEMKKKFYNVDKIAAEERQNEQTVPHILQQDGNNENKNVTDIKETAKNIFSQSKSNEEPVLRTMDEALKYFNLDTDEMKKKMYSEDKIVAKEMHNHVANVENAQTVPRILQQGGNDENKNLNDDDIKETVKNTFSQSKSNEELVLSTGDEALRYFNLDNDERKETFQIADETAAKERQDKETVLNSMQQRSNDGNRRGSDDANARKTACENISHDAAITIVDDTFQYFKAENVNVNQNYLSIGESYKKNKSQNAGSKTKEKKKKPKVYNEAPSKDSPDCSKKSRDPNIKTLEDALQYFGLSSHLSGLEKSLEEVRRRKKSKEDHERDFKKIDKEMQKLSFSFHPDRVKNRGGSDEEIATAQTLQTALNATRTVLSILNEAFVDDIDTDHKYGFYTKLNINSLGNEDEIKNRVYEVFFKIGLISEIKQKKIIAEIRKFLIESKNCIQSYFDEKINDFEKHRDAALFHLKYCIKGYKILCAEFEAVEKECKLEKLDNIYSLIRKMSSDSLRELRQLKQLKEVAKKSLAGKYQFYDPAETVDDYFVTPFVCYTNVILMCNAMTKNVSSLGRKMASLSSLSSSFDIRLVPKYNSDLNYLVYPYYLASFYSGNHQHKDVVLKILGKFKVNPIRQQCEYVIHKSEIVKEFRNVLFESNSYLEYKFNVDDYAEGSNKDGFVEELKKCMTMMSEFREQKQELSEGIEKLNSKAEEIEEKYENIMKKTEQLNRKVQERLEQSKNLADKTSLALSENFETP